MLMAPFLQRQCSKYVVFLVLLDYFRSIDFLMGILDLEFKATPLTLSSKRQLFKYNGLFLVHRGFLGKAAMNQKNSLICGLGTCV